MAAKVYIAGGFGNLLFQYIGIKYLQKKGINKIIVKNTLVSNSVLTRILRWQFEDYSHLIFDEENIIKRFRI